MRKQAHPFTVNMDWSVAVVGTAWRGIMRLIPGVACRVQGMGVGGCMCLWGIHSSSHWHPPNSASRVFFFNACTPWSVRAQTCVTLLSRHGFSIQVRCNRACMGGLYGDDCRVKPTIGRDEGLVGAPCDCAGASSRVRTPWAHGAMAASLVSVL